ncbi:hypothetical protein [Promicromonospora panici]|uniref:hypothetical protein n=1 Tax=Promicromonospora panici TaxID=2219658 RepID=UPI0013EDCB28|nr:hypothetical protein [Promicromonospora panici]
MPSQPISPQPDHPVTGVHEPDVDDLPPTTRIHMPPSEVSSHRPTAEVLDELREDRL